MLKTFTAALIAASMLTAPAFAQGTAPAPSAPATQVTKAPAVKVVKAKKHAHVRKHVRHVRHARHWRHHVKQVTAKPAPAVSAKPAPARAVETVGSAPKAGKN